MGYRLPVMLAMILTLVGCGTTKWTDTSRSATEQLLISDAMDRAVSGLDLRALAGREVWLDTKPVQEATDSPYLVSSLRQHMLASGCILKENQADAKYVVEVRSGAVGTDHHELVYGVPRVDIPALIPVSGVGVPPNIPELKLVTRTDQRAVVKLAVFAYNRETGRPVWQSGIAPIESTVKAVWVFGAGPFQRGDIYKGTTFAGDKLKIPLIDLGEPDGEAASVSVADEAYFLDQRENLAKDVQSPGAGDEAKPAEAAKNAEPTGASSAVIQTGHTQPGDPAGAGQAPATQASQPKPPPADNPPPKAPPPTEKPPAGDSTSDPAATPATQPPQGAPPDGSPQTETPPPETPPSETPAAGAPPNTSPLAFPPPLPPAIRSSAQALGPAPR